MSRTTTRFGPIDVFTAGKSFIASIGPTQTESFEPVPEPKQAIIKIALDHVMSATKNVECQAVFSDTGAGAGLAATLAGVVLCFGDSEMDGYASMTSYFPGTTKRPICVTEKGFRAGPAHVAAALIHEVAHCAGAGAPFFPLGRTSHIRAYQAGAICTNDSIARQDLEGAVAEVRMAVIWSQGKMTLDGLMPQGGRCGTCGS